MDDVSPRPAHPGQGIDYQRAAERLLVALSFIAQKQPTTPVPAVQLAIHAFPREQRQQWKRESTRRRVREAVIAARNILIQQHGTFAHQVLVGSGQGYLMTGDATIIRWYASQRRRHSLTHLVAASQTQHTAAHAHQAELFPDSGTASIPAGTSSKSAQSAKSADKETP